MRSTAGAALPPGAGAAGRAAPADAAHCRRSASAVGALHRLAQPLRLQVVQARVAARAGAAARSSRLGHQQFGGDRRRRRAQVGGEVGEAEVGFVADRRHHRHRRGGDRARQALVVERPQVFQRTAAAGQQDHVVAARRRRALQHRDDLRRGAVALHRHRQHVGLDQREAPRQHAQHVAHGRAAGRGDHRRCAGRTRGSGRLRSSSNRPSAASFALSSSKARRSAPSPASSMWSSTSW